MPRSAIASLQDSRFFPAALAAVAILAMPGLSIAQSNDVPEPFLGTWSGSFTTQSHEYWGIEDFICFPGCSKAAHDHMVALLDDPANDDRSVGELMGETSAYAVSHLLSILTPLGIEIQKANLPENDPKLHCQPYGLVRQVMNPLPMSIRRLGDHLLFQYEEWSLLRTVFLDGRAHPEYLTESLLGHAVGRIEDGALIIETAGVVPDRFSDTTQGGYSSELTAVERYTVHDNPRRLELELTLEDPLILKQPHVMTKSWLWTPDVELLQDSCGDLPGVY